LIGVWTSTRTIAEVEEAMIAHSVPAGGIYRAADMLEDPHFAARDALVEVEHPRWGKIKMQNAFPKLSDTPSSVRRRAPLVPGQDNADVYGSLLGLSDQELDDLRARQAI
jgi:formyl-CoA transferase